MQCETILQHLKNDMKPPLNSKVLSYKELRSSEKNDWVTNIMWENKVHNQRHRVERGKIVRYSSTWGKEESKWVRERWNERAEKSPMRKMELACHLTNDSHNKKVLSYNVKLRHLSRMIVCGHKHWTWLETWTLRHQKETRKCSEFYV